MTFQQLASVDLNALSKTQLKAYTKLAREEWGQQIDLRSANIHDLIEYLQMYLHFKAESENSISCTEPEEIAPVTESEDALTIVSEAEADVITWITLLYAGTPELPAGHVADINLITRLFPSFTGGWLALRDQIAFRVQPDSSELYEGEFYGVERCDRKELYAHILPNLAWLRQVEDDEVMVFRQISEFEGIDDLSMSDWWVSSPLTCDICNYQMCYLPEPSAPLPMKSPASFNAHAMNAIDILLEKTPDGLVTTEWLSGILHDCMWRVTKPEKISEMLLLDPTIYYGLAGLDVDDVSLFKRAVSCPGEFAELSADAKEGADHYQKIGGLLGNEALGEMVIYHTIRDNLNYLQSLMGVSSLRTRNYAIRDKLFTRQDYDYQMILLPSDRTVLKAEVIRVTEYFRRITTEYDKFREMPDESLEPLGDIDIMALAAEAEHSWLTDESWEWNEAKTSGKFAYKVDPDSIHLSFCRWDTSVNDFSPFFTVVATHPDPSRFPWKEHQQD